MNDPNSEWDAFERQLRQIQPARPSDELMARLENRPDPRPEGAGIDLGAVVRFFVLSLGGATTLVLLFAGWFVARNAHISVTTGSASAPAVASESSLVCTGSTESVVAVRDEGIYTDAAGRPVQVIRLLDLNKSVWNDPRSGNRIEIVRPRQQLLVKDAETY